MGSLEGQTRRKLPDGLGLCFPTGLLSALLQFPERPRKRISPPPALQNRPENGTREQGPEEGALTWESTRKSIINDSTFSF